MSLPLNPTQTSILQDIRLTAQTAANNLALPAGSFIREIRIKNTTANAITGGLKFGSTSGGTDVVTAQAVGASAIVFVTDATLLKRSFSDSAIQQIFFDAVTSWNSASVQIDVLYYQL